MNCEKECKHNVNGSCVTFDQGGSCPYRVEITPDVLVDRAYILSEAKRCVCGDREEDYGSPEDNFRTIADLWTVYLRGCGVQIDSIEPHDVAAMMTLLKIARIASGKGKRDNWIDIAGYAACGGELDAEK